MYLEVLEAGEALVTGGTTVRLLIRVSANVDEHLVPAATQKSVKSGSSHPVSLFKTHRFLTWH